MVFNFVFEIDTIVNKNQILLCNTKSFCVVDYQYYTVSFILYTEMAVKIGIRREMFKKEYWMSDCLEKKHAEFDKFNTL